MANFPIRNKLFSCFLLVLALHFSPVRSQTVGVGSFLDESLRQLQLEGKLDIKYSLAARPFFNTSDVSADSLYHLISDKNPLYATKRSFLSGSLELLPVGITVKFNSHHPYGWNEQGLLQAKGLQTRLSTGFFFKKGILSVQFKPEVALAANPTFEHNADYGAVSTGGYHKMFLGQSSIRLSKGALSVGISTENCWWGPGIYNSLLMSNNAPGFLHGTFNTTRPVKTPIGNFEWQLVMGKLVEDQDVLLENKNLITTYYNPETYGGYGYSGPYDAKEKWRYFSGLTLSYNPKWIPGLFIGFSRVAYTYHNKIDSVGSSFDFFHKYFPTLFGAFREGYAYGNDFNNHAIGYKQMASFNFRYLFQKAHTEVYAEYGLQDNAYNLRDLSLDPQHAVAYTVGMKKMKPLGANKWLDISAEITHMAESLDYILRTSGAWYQYQGGYTHQNRIIGAGVGSANNVQTFRLSHMDGFNKLGVVVQAIQHDPTVILGDLSTLGLRATKWNDVSIGFNGQRRIKKIVLNGEIQFVHSNNYAWEKGKNRFNCYALLNFFYIW